MHALSRLLLVVPCAFSMSGCSADGMGVTGTRSSPVPLVNSAGCGDGSLPCYADSDTDIIWPKIYSVSPVVYWKDDQPTVSNSSSAMSFYGNCFRIELSIQISGPTEITRDGEPTADCPSFVPTGHNVNTVGHEVVVNGTCGHVANLTGRHYAYTRAFLEYQGLSQLEASASRSRGARQPDCCPRGTDKDVGAPYSLAPDGEPMLATASACTGGGGSSGSGTTTIHCYTLTVENYWYYPDTDTYEYRYSENTTWCEESSE